MSGSRIPERHSSGYMPLSGYGIIGNRMTCCLVAVDGSIDWCCMPCIASESVFGALLDNNRGGRFKVTLPEVTSRDQQYIGDSNVLRTTMENESGRLAVTDFMPIEGDLNEPCYLQSEEAILRILECEGNAAIEVVVEWSPRMNYACSTMRMERDGDKWVATDGKSRLLLSGLDGGDVIHDRFGPILKKRFRMNAGESRVLATIFDESRRKYGQDESIADMKRTIGLWETWAHSEEASHSEKWAGSWLPSLIRSELVLKLLAFGQTGAIVAAPTTSLPEEIGGIRNWDYRYAWLRDAAMTAQALVVLGHRTEAWEFVNWLEKMEMSDGEGLDLQIMYGIRGERELDERELHHLEGYRGSRPVRVGNGAWDQFQLETYGEVLHIAYEMLRRGEEFEYPIRNFLERVADETCVLWQRPDHGIWEMRGEPQHFVYSKMMAWVALDRAIALQARNQISGNVSEWRKNRELIMNDVLVKGYDPERGSFVQAYGSKELDAANLRLPLMELLTFDDMRVRGTIDGVLRELTENGQVYRYRSDDGLQGGEGTFSLCTLWLVDALALSGRVEEAEEIYEGILGHANHLGLLSEQLDPVTGELLGNFPQAFTHVGLINSAVYLAYAQGRETPDIEPIGTDGHRRSLERYR